MLAGGMHETPSAAASQPHRGWTPVNRGRYARSVVVSHPGTQHSAVVASALMRAGYLDRYFTGVVWRRDAPLGRGLRRLRWRWARRIERELGRRSSADIGPRSAQVLPGLELLHVVTSRLGSPGLTQRALWLRNELFDRRVAAEVERRRPAAVLCYDSSALHTFRAARRVGTLTVLDQSVGHIRSAVAMLRDEDGAAGRRAAALAPDWLIARCSAEATEADFVLSPSAYVESTLLSHGVDMSRIVYMPFGVDTERFRPAGSRGGSGRFRMLFVGQVSRRKGIPYLLDAVADLEIAEAELVLVGGLEDARAVEPYARCFTHVSHVPYAEVHRLFQQADVFVYPSLHEGSALAIYEALASGLPVVTTFNSGSVVRDGVEGFVVPVRDASAIREKLRVLHAQPELRRRMGQSARERAEGFTWDAYGRRLRGFLDAALSGSRGVPGGMGHARGS
jgi:glycosyltransferase involved in cell wall biosynthesis